MITFKKVSLVLIVSLLYMIHSGCKEKSPEAIYISEQHDKIMVVHDDVMPKMSDIYKLKKKMKKDDALRESHLIDSLEYAEEVMMEWMHDYDKPSDSDPNYEVYLNQQMEAVTEVRDVMLRIINKSEKALNL